LKLDQNLVDDLKGRIGILDVVSDFVSMKRVGQNYRALSPFSNERTPSFYVSPSKGIYKCFSTGKGGDAISFVMEHEGMNYVEALKYLGKKYGIDLEEEKMTEDELKNRNQRESLYIILNFAKEYFRDLLWNHEEGKQIGLSYFMERGFREDIIKRFELGYSLDKWEHLLNTATQKGYQEEFLIKAGLVIKKEESKKGREMYDRFRGRVIFPIHNLSGKPIAFGGRILKSNEKQPKYINSPETEVYHKSSSLYGLFQAKKAVRQEDNVYLVEGYTDVMALHQVGIENVVASSGTSLTEEQIRMISRFSKNITVVFDGDPAGIKASLRGIDMMLEHDLNVHAVALPEGEDPDSYARQLGGGVFKDFLREERKDFITFKAELFENEAQQNPLKRAEIIRDIVESISKIPDPIKRSVYIKECSDLLDMDESVLIAEQNKILITRAQKKEASGGQHSASEVEDAMTTKKAKPDQEDAVAIREKKDLLLEKELIRLIISHGLNELEDEQKLHDYLHREMEQHQFHTQAYKEIMETFYDGLENNEIKGAPYKFLMDRVSEEAKNAIVDIVMETERYKVSDNWESKFQIYVPKEEEILDRVGYNYVLRWKAAEIRKFIFENLEKLKATENLELENELLRNNQAYKKLEMEIANRRGNVTPGL